VLIDQVYHVLLFFVVQLSLQAAVFVLQLLHPHSQIRHFYLELVVKVFVVRLNLYFCLFFLLQQVQVEFQLVVLLSQARDLFV